MIDINCDLGEGMANDAKIMPFLDSCNIACGGHYGDSCSMNIAVDLALKHGVKVGAHPSFPDRENFGRKNVNISAEQLQFSLYQQIDAFLTICQQHDVEMHHIKLHGALYNLAARDAEIAALVLNVFAAVHPDIKIYVPYQSVIATLAEDYFPIAYEAFIDRRYHSDLRLVARTHSNAVIHDMDEAWQQMSNIINHGCLTSVENKKVKIKADTFCLHGDEENALDLVKHIRVCLSR